LRLVPGNTFVHRLWAGTKLVVAAELALIVSISPSWAMIGIAAGVVLLGLVLGRIPLGAFPRLPRWFFYALLIGAALSMLSDAEPVVHLGAFDVSMGGLSDWARFTALAIVLVTSGALVGWTTPLGEIAPALARLTRPLRVLRLPVQEWIVAVALAIRCLPMLIDEVRTLSAARRLRVHDPDAVSKASFKQLIIEAHDLLATAIVTSLRRARDLADAMVARGGIGGAVSASTQRMRLPDAIVLLLVTALGVVTIAVLHL
jgi:energy-coupling factor transporter transmembrane protein EcfT